MCPAPKLLTDCFGMSRPGCRGPNLTDVVAVSCRSARGRNSRAIQRWLRSLSRGVGFSFWRWRWGGVWRCYRSPEWTRRRCVAGNWSLPGSRVLAASADWKWIWPMAFAVNALQNISTFTAFPLTSSTTPTSNGSRAFIRKTGERVEKYFLAAVAGSDKDYNAEYRIIRPSDDEIRWICTVAERSSAISKVGL